MLQHRLAMHKRNGSAASGCNCSWMQWLYTVMNTVLGNSAEAC